MLGPGDTLCPVTGQVGPWSTGVNTARCARGAGHTAPDTDCSCGIYAFHAMHNQLRHEPVVGAIAAWGDMEVHRDGFRAERAAVLALSGTGLGRSGDAALRRAAERYGVPIVARR